MKVHRLVENDLPAVLALDMQTNPHPWNQAQWQDSLRQHVCLGLTSQDRLLGVVVAMPLPEEAELLLIAVQPAHQGLGLGRELLQALLDLLRAEYRERLFLEVRTSNVRAQKFYAAAGFQEIGRRKNYYPAQTGREDALLYALNLKGAS